MRTAILLAVVGLTACDPPTVRLVPSAKTSPAASASTSESPPGGHSEVPACDCPPVDARCPVTLKNADGVIECDELYKYVPLCEKSFHPDPKHPTTWDERR